MFNSSIPDFLLEKQDEYLDIVFAFGSFGSPETAGEIFEKEKQLINSFVDSIQKRDTRYGVIEIGPRAKICAMIGQFRDHVRLKRHVNLIRRSGDASGLDHALELAASMFEKQARSSSRRVLIVFTNGKSGAEVRTCYVPIWPSYIHIELCQLVRNPKGVGSITTIW